MLKARDEGLEYFENHGKTYWEKLRSINPPCVPFIGKSNLLFTISSPGGVKDWAKKIDTNSRHDCSTNIDPGAKNDKARSKQNL